MKVAFAALSTLVVSVFSTPTAPADLDIGNALQQLEALLGGGGFDAIAAAVNEPTKREIQSVNDIPNILSVGLGSIRSNTASINMTLAGVESGALSKDEASVQVMTQLNEVEHKLSDIIQELLGAAGIDANGANLDRLLGGTTELLSEVLHTVKGVVNLLGLSKALSNVVNGITGTLGDLVKALGTVVGKVLPNLVPNLVKTLRNLVDGLRHGLLSPLLRGLADVLNGLAG